MRSWWHGLVEPYQASNQAEVAYRKWRNRHGAALEKLPQLESKISCSPCPCTAFRLHARPGVSCLMPSLCAPSRCSICLLHFEDKAGAAYDCATIAM
jgi:hypothetical protein